MFGWRFWRFAVGADPLVVEACEIPDMIDGVCVAWIIPVGADGACA